MAAFSSASVNVASIATRKLYYAVNPNANTDTTVNINYTLHIFSPTSDKTVLIASGSKLGSMIVLRNTGVGILTIRGSFVDAKSQACTRLVLKTGSCGQFFFDSTHNQWKPFGTGYHFGIIQTTTIAPLNIGGIGESKRLTRALPLTPLNPLNPQPRIPKPDVHFSFLATRRRSLLDRFAPPHIGELDDVTDEPRQALATPKTTTTASDTVTSASITEVTTHKLRLEMSPTPDQDTVVNLDYSLQLYAPTTAKTLTLAPGTQTGHVIVLVNRGVGALTFTSAFDDSNLQPCSRLILRAGSSGQFIFDTTRNRWSSFGIGYQFAA